MINKNQEAFFALLRAGLWEERSLPLNAYRLPESADKIDWSKVLDLAEEQSVVGLLAAGIETVQGSWLKVHGFPLVPKPIALQFIGRTVQLEQRNQAMNCFIGVMVEKMREAGIYTLLVKGQGVAQCYERPLWRVCGDVDLFLSEDNYLKAKKFLLPFASSVEEEFVREKHLGMTINGWVVELHGHLYSGLSSKVEKELDALHQDTFNEGQVRSWMNGKTQVFMLKAENDAFYVFTHILQHFYKGGIGLRQICDWCRLMWTYRDKIDWEKLKSRLKKAGIMSEWKAFYALSSKYLGMPDIDSGFMCHDSRFDKKTDRIMEFILKSGNMGHNRDMSHFNNKSYFIRKCVSMGRRVSDLINHARIFPMDSLRFFPRIMWNGVVSAIRGE